nr:hypothetical protein BaRGS_027772 [Batillaria attramentaria]
MSSFFVAPGSTLHVEFIPNAGIRLHNVAIADAGTYSVHVNLDVHGSIVREVQTVELEVSDQSLTTDGQLHVKMLPQAVFDNSTQQYRVQLSCGDFLPVWSSKVAVLWKTPSNETLTSTSMDNGRFLLSVPNPVVSGEYTCVLDDTSPASLCVDSDSPLQRGATTNVDGVQAQFAVLGAQMTSLQQREGRVKQENADLKQQLETLTHQDTDLQQQLQTLTQNGDKLTQQLQTLKTEDADLKQQIESAKQDIANMQPKTENATDGVSFQAWRRGFGGRDALGGHFNFQELQQRFPNYHFPTYAHSAGDNVLFDHVTTNEGHAYDEDTGVFTVPTIATAFEWTSTQNLPDNTTVPACPGQDVTFPWRYTAGAEEHLSNVEWRFQPAGGSEVVLATEVMNSFFVAPGSSMHIESIPNADQPLTTDGQLHVKMLPQAVYDNSTQQYRVQLSCGDFLPVWSSKVAVLWKTPSNQTLPSTYSENGRFLLSVPNPVVSGEYTCILDDTSPASLCVDSSSPLQRGVTTNVDGVQAQFAVMGAQMSSLQQENAALNQQLQAFTQKDTDLTHQLETLTHEDTNLKQQLEALKNEDASIKQQLATLTQTNANLQSKLDAAPPGVSFQAWREGNRDRSHIHHVAGVTPSITYEYEDHRYDADDTVVFEHVTTNEGNAYNSHTGVFTAPVDGTYAFFVSVETHGAVGLEVGDNVVSAFYRDPESEDNYAAGSLHAIVSLTAGQQVAVKSLQDRTTLKHSSNRDITFSGALLHPAALP